MRVLAELGAVQDPQVLAPVVALGVHHQLLVEGEALLLLLTEIGEKVNDERFELPEEEFL